MKTGVSPEKWPLARKRNFIRGRNFFWVALGVLVICPFDKKLRCPNKKLTFLSQIQIFSGQNCTFLSQGASPVNVFNTKEVSHWFPDVRVPKVLLKNCPVWPKTGIFGQMLAFLPYLVPCQPENNANKVPNFCFLQKKLWFLAPKLPNLAQYMHFWSFWAKFGHFLPIWAHARPKNNANKVAGWFSDKWVPELMLPPKMIWINGPKMAKFGPKLAFFVKYWHF